MDADTPLKMLSTINFKSEAIFLSNSFQLAKPAGADKPDPANTAALFLLTRLVGIYNF